MYGLLANGENGQGIATNIIKRAMVNHISMVLYFSLLVALRFAKAEPMVITTTAVTIRVIWINPKKSVSMFCTASLKFNLKYLIMGLYI